MRNKSWPAAALLCFITGLLLVTVGQFIAGRCQLPDAVNGLVAGFGLGLQLMALIYMKGNKPAF